MATVKKVCKYGETCYRKNEDHLKNYLHKSEDAENEASPGSDQDIDIKAGKNTVKGNKRGRKAESAKTEEEEPVSKKAELENKPAEAKPTEAKPEETTPKDNGPTEHFELNQVKDMKEFVFEHNSMHMPDDFYEFFDFCKKLDPKDPKNALKLIDLELTGIYDLIISGAKHNYNLHSRYFYDTPEFQTVLRVKNSPTHLHFGYFRDDPNEMPDFVASNEPSVGCTISCKGENLFSAVIWFIDELVSKRTYQVSSNPSADELKKLKKSIEDWCQKAEKNGKSLPLQLKTNKIKAREKKINCKTFHQAGICVPVDSNGVGYREVPETDDSQRKMFKNFCSKDVATSLKNKADESIQEIVTLIQFANDEMDYGMALEFGTNMFCFGDVGLHKYIRAVLPVSYNLLGRELYTQILKEHLKSRNNPI